MQWIYGGAWILCDNFEFGIYNASHLATTHDVIVVAGDYRLDAMGWLALKDMVKESGDQSMGNFGLADQRFAMQWTQRNIKAFGGDPDTVTIFGESAGAFSVCQHTVSPKSNGLFSRAIIQSGDCDGPWMIHDGEDASAFGSAYATAVGCPTGESQSQLDCLRKKHLKDVMEPYSTWYCPKHGTAASQALQKLRESKGFNGDDPWCKNKTFNKVDPSWPTPNNSPTDWKPWPEPVPPFAPIAGFAAVVDGSERGLPDVPLRLIQAGQVNKDPKGRPISVIMGTNHDELALFTVAIPLVIPGTSLPISKDTMSTTASFLAKYHNHWNATTAKQMLVQYPESDFKTPADRFVTFGTDFVFRCGTRSAVRAFASAGVKAYMYQFNYHSSLYRDPSSSQCERDDEIGCGVYHGSDVTYVFGTANFLHPAPPARNMSSVMGRYWTNFAKHGSPNGDDVPKQWQNYNIQDDNHLDLTLPVTNGSHLFKSNCDFWDSLPRAGQYPPRAPSAEILV